LKGQTNTDFFIETDSPELSATTAMSAGSLASAEIFAARRFPPPWSVEQLEACFVVKDSAGQKLAYVYYEEVPGRRSAAKLLSRDEARRIA
jgi:hypothetical protein